MRKDKMQVIAAGERNVHDYGCVVVDLQSEHGMGMEGWYELGGFS